MTAAVEAVPHHLRASSSALPAWTAVYAQRWLQSMRSALADRLADGNLDALASLLDRDGPHSLREPVILELRGC